MNYLKKTRLTTKAARQRRRRVEDSDAQGELGPGVDAGQVEHHAREEATLGEPQERAQGNELGEVVHEAQAHAKEAPHKGQSGQPDARRQALEKEVARDFALDREVSSASKTRGRDPKEEVLLHGDVKGVEGGQALVVVGVGHVEVRLEMVELGIANIGTIEE